MTGWKFRPRWGFLIRNLVLQNLATAFAVIPEGEPSKVSPANHPKAPRAHPQTPAINTARYVPEIIDHAIGRLRKTTAGTEA